MKTKNKSLVLSILATVGLVSLFLPHNKNIKVSGIDITFDSGWVSQTPSNRSVEVLGQDLNNLFSNRPKNQFANVAVFGAELALAMHFELCLHELGHANYAKSVGGQYVFETGDKNFFKYLVGHKVFSNGATYTNLNPNSTTSFRGFLTAGFNAETQFIEDGKLDLAWQIPGRFSTWLYRASHVDPALNDARALPYSSRDMRVAQLLTYAASFFGPQFYAYFNDKDISVRGVHTFGKYTVALESTINFKNAEIQIGRKFSSNGLAFTPKVTIGKGINLEATAQYKNLVVGFVRHSQNTLSGARVPSNEVYAQYCTRF